MSNESMGLRSSGRVESPVETAFTAYFGRLGSALLDVRDRDEGPEELRSLLTSSLEADSRVSYVYETEARDAWSHDTHLYPLDNDCPHCLVTGADSFTGLRLNSPIYFRLHIPIKNQPRKMDADDVPTEDYWVAWDGTTVLVLWGREDGEEVPAESAGQVAYSVLTDAARQVEMRMRAQPCSPECQNLFAHSELVIRMNDEIDGLSELSRIDGPMVDCAVIGSPQPLSIMSILSLDLFLSALTFAQLKNCRQRIMDLEQHARYVVGELLSLDATQLAPKASGLKAKLGRGWTSLIAWSRGKGRGARSRRMAAELWLAMANLEVLFRDHLRLDREMEDEMKDDGIRVLFENDLRGGKENVAAINLEFIRAAVEQSSTRRGTVTIAWATVLGAFAGGAMGFVGSMASRS